MIYDQSLNQYLVYLFVVNARLYNIDLLVNPRKWIDNRVVREKQEDRREVDEIAKNKKLPL
jgi:hypothetical protein